MKKSLRDSIIAMRRLARRLARDVAGNTLAMMAISLIPISAMIGSGVDMSRAYLVKSRLQQACDAGALAGRRAMTGPTLDSNAETQARNLFNFNFPTGTMQTTNLIFTPTNTVDENGSPSGQVTATASVTVPTTIMKMFGKQTITLDVECDAKLEVTNTDIMFVLDVTGSMNCPVGVPNDCGLVEQTSSKLSALRTAVVNFYTTVNTAMTTDARLRIGFVPYSTTVNVGYLLPSSYLVDADHALYQSRERVLVDTSTSTSSGSWPANNSTSPSWSGYSGWTTVSNNTVSGSSACIKPATTYSAGPETVGSPSSSTNSSTGVITTTTATTRLMTEISYQKTYTSSSKNCKIESRTRTRTETKSDTETVTPNYDWKYKQ
jgi:Flp pilus assembly protein TadG